MSASLNLPFFRFLRVEDFFSSLDQWDRVLDVQSSNFSAADKRLYLTLSTTAAGLENPILVVQFLRADTYRLRFNPDKHTEDAYPDANSRAIVVESLNLLDKCGGSFDVAFADAVDTITLTTRQNGADSVRLQIAKSPFRITAQVFEDGHWVTLLEDDVPAVRFRKVTVDGWKKHDWSTVFARRKRPFTKYIGFGEKGGGKLCHNGSQLTYFNYDNMRYRQVYNLGPLDPREPLYDTNPFFLEFAADPDSDAVIGTFMDNTSELCLDIGFQNTGRVLLGSYFGDVDIYQILSTSCLGISKAHTTLVGTPRLKPRYVLGYHQGCYGYENRDTLLAVARAYRANRFPIDGLHIDVDIQDRYRTFTIDQAKFPNPQDMFRELRELGVKCSTNITPIISNRGDGYSTYQTGAANGYFINDHRELPHPNDYETHQDFDNGFENAPGNTNPRINNGQPFEGEVYYGGDRGTPGHYPDFGRKEVRIWWGQQYQYLFDMGLEFVWQDMTSPCIRDNRGDMRSLPFDLHVTDDSIRKFENDGVTSSDDVHNAPEYPKAPFITIQNLFSYNLHKATYYGLNELPSRQGLRNFIIGRGGFAGTQRFAALWTGDNASDWEFYRINVAQVLGLGMSGQPMSGADIGGFESHNGESWVDPELFIRWMIAGAFLPWFRNHYIAKGIKQFQEPYRFVEVLNRVPQQDQYLYLSVLPVTRYYVELRYRLLQLFYDAMFDNVCSGLPIARPLFLHDEKDKSLFADKLNFLDDEFLVGKDLLVAPVMEPRTEGAGQRDIYLPAGGDWYVFMNALQPLNGRITGGSTIRFGAEINSDPAHIPFILPMFVRAGAIIPVIELEQYVGQRRIEGGINPVTLYIYPGPQGEYTMYLDDGISRASAKHKDEDLGGDPAAANQYQEVKITHTLQPGAPARRAIDIAIGNNQYTPKEDFFFVAIVHDPTEQRGSDGPLRAVTVGGAALPLLSGNTIADRSTRLWASPTDAYYHHEAANITYLKIHYQNASRQIVAEYV